MAETFVNTDLELFTERLTDVNGVVHTGSPLEEVVSILEAQQARSFVAWDEVGVDGLHEALAQRGFERVDHRVGDDRKQRYGPLSRVPVGITGADAALAESGSLVLRSGEGRPRLVSLVPPVHVALVARSTVYRSLTHWMGAHGDEVGMVANTVFITGPSRTGDIEQVLTLGVHGPGEVHVVLID